MDSVLYKIIEIEREAQNISEEAIKAKRNLPNEIEEEKQRRSVQIDEQIKKQIEQFEQDEAADEAKRTAEIERQQKLQLSALRELFSKNHEIWEKDLYDTIRKK